jgi:lysyl endopeptidase
VGVVVPRFAGNITPQATTGTCGDPDCVVDATCVSGTPADPAKNAVAKMEWAQGQFMYTCTGGLINDNNPSLSNLFLTAAHCLGNNKTARNLQFYWKFATPSCNGACPVNTGWPYKTMGSTIVTTGKKGDFTLVRLDAAPPAGSVFLGWSTTAVAFTSGAHLYRISNPNTTVDGAFASYYASVQPYINP